MFQRESRAEEFSIETLSLLENGTIIFGLAKLTGLYKLHVVGCYCEQTISNESRSTPWEPSERKYKECIEQIVKLIKNAEEFSSY